MRYFFSVLIGSLLLVGCAGILGVKPTDTTPVTQDQAIENQIQIAETIFTGASFTISIAKLNPQQRAAANAIVESNRKLLDKVEADARAGKLIDISTVNYVALQLAKDYADYRAKNP